MLGRKSSGKQEKGLGGFGWNGRRVETLLEYKTGVLSNKLNYSPLNIDFSFWGQNTHGPFSSLSVDNRGIRGAS